MLSKLKGETDLSAVAGALKAVPFRPHPLFPGGHAQTLAGYFYPRRRKLGARLASSEERLFEVEPGVRILARCHWQSGEKQRHPTVLLVHGLEGSSESVYMLGAADAAFANGFNVVRLNLRTCGGTEHLTETLYHSGMSADLRCVIEELIGRDGLQQIYLAGFSLGGNMSLKLAGEWGEDAPPALRGVCAVSPSIDLASCADQIARSSNSLYNRRFLHSLKKKMRRVQKLYPERYEAEDVATLRSIREFDRRFTARYGGFRDVDDYYARASSRFLLKNIRVPTLIVHAADDPFVPFEPFLDRSLGENPFIILLAPPRGGHVGFIAAAGNSDKSRFWAENRMIQFFQLLQTESAANDF